MSNHAPSPVPLHVAIVMDGNGRWAKGRGLPRTAGHKAGADAVRRVLTAARDTGVKYLTLFAFSTENWSRPETEVSTLMGLLRQYLRGEGAELHKNNVRLRVVGFRDRMPADVVRTIEQIEHLTEKNTGAVLTLAIDYGGRADIVQAVKRIVDAGLPADAIDETVLNAFLLTAGLPDPDLIIRTSGEQRVSNFLLWQGAYAEFYFTDTLWPDFDETAFAAALAAFAGRERRFGAVTTASGKAG